LVRAQASHASSISREDRIVRAGPIVTLLGGKLTTYRAMAEKAWSQVREVLPPAGRARCRGDPWPKRVSAATSDTSTLAQRHAVPVSLCDHLASFYGPAVAGVLKLISDDPALCDPLCAGCSEIGAQVAHAAIHERALHLDDVLLRRLPLGMGKHRVGDAVDRSADIMARLLGWDVARRTDEIARYLAALYPPATPQTEAQGQ
jgi:glycerol-3-phosphate dehydrogenase